MPGIVTGAVGVAAAWLASGVRRRRREDSGPSLVLSERGAALSTSGGRQDGVLTAGVLKAEGGGAKGSLGIDSFEAVVGSSDSSGSEGSDLKSFLALHVCTLSGRIGHAKMVYLTHY